MPVNHVCPATWRGRSYQEVAYSLQIEKRSQRLYQRLSDGLLEGLSRIGARFQTRFYKGRSNTQTPSAFQRFCEELVALYVAGASPERLRLAVVEIGRIVDELCPASPSVESLLMTIHAANESEGAERLAESRLLTRQDRAITEGDLDAFVEATSAEIAAKKEQLHTASKLRRQFRTARLGISVRGAA